MKKKIVKSSCLFMAAMLIAGLICGCGSGNSSRSASAQQEAGAPMKEAGYNGFAADMDVYEEDCYAEAPAEAPAEAAGSVEGNVPTDYSQKLIRTYRYNFETQDFHASMNFIQQNVEKYEGYIESSEIYGNDYPNADITLRIPSDKVDSFLGEIGSIGEVIYQSVSTEDITLNYYDTASRLESLHAQHDRLIQLIEKAENLADIAQLEGQLSNVEYEINSYQSRLNMYDNLVDYTTIYMNLCTVREITVVEKDTFGTRIMKGLRRNTGNLFRDAEDLLIWLITMIPYFLVLGVAAAIVIPVVKAAKAKVHQKKSKKDAKKEENQQE